jgi:hypothetical protein
MAMVKLAAEAADIPNWADHGAAFHQGNFEAQRSFTWISS